MRRHVHWQSAVKPPRVSDRARARLKDELRARHLNLEGLAELLTKETEEVWSTSRAQKVLQGRTGLRVDDLSAICDVLKLSVAEAVRDRGLEFYAELTPTEMRIVEILRRDAQLAASVLYMLGIRPPAEKTAHAADVSHPRHKPDVKRNG